MESDFLQLFLESHGDQVVVLLLFLGALIATFVILPQVLSVHRRKLEMAHEENMKALECNIPVPQTDNATKLAGRATMAVPVVVIITAGIVTAFMTVYRSEALFSVALAVWTVCGVVSLAAITGGVALIGRLAQLKTGDEDEMVPDNPMTESN